MKWSWNENDGECWTHGTFDTKEEAIEDAYGCKEMIKRNEFLKCYTKVVTGVANEI